MRVALLKREMREARWLLVGCILALFAFCWMRVWIIGRIDTEQFQVVMEQLWDQIEKFSPVPLKHLLTFTGRVAMTFTEPLLVLIVSGWAIARGSAAVSSKLAEGVMEVLLAQPIRRWQLLSCNALVTSAGVVVLSVVSWIGVAVAIETTTIKESQPRKVGLPGFPLQFSVPFLKGEVVERPLREKTSPTYYIPAAINLGCLAFALAGFSTAMSAWDRYRWRTVGIMIGFLVLQSMMILLAKSVPDFHWVGYFTIFTLYQPEVAVQMFVDTPQDLWAWTYESPMNQQRQLAPLAANLLLLMLGLASYIWAIAWFERRDLPAPL